MTHRSDREGTLVVIPTYNERDNLEPVIARVHAARPEVQVLVVDDGSPDGTGAIADRLARGDDRVHVLHRTEKAGLGAAYLAGFAWGLCRGHAVLVEMDADGSHRPEELGRLLDRCASGADLVIGSRWVPGGSVVNWPWYRIALSRGGSLYSRIMLGVRVRDLTGGYRAVRADLIRTLVAEDIASTGYCFQVDVARRALRAGAVVAEVPVTFVERERGASKMSSAIVVEALVRVTGWGLQRAFRRASR
jgi:dolichol-phosphate mannosyltransferase